MTTHHYALRIAYNGQKFFGWQVQSQGKTIQGEIQEALRVFLKEPVKLIGGSRTDSGVHAMMQLASFKCQQEVDTIPFLSGMRALLPEDIAVNSIEKVSLDFHPIHALAAKKYSYLLLNSYSRNPFIIPFCWHCRYALDIEAMNKGLKILLGRHNFKGFCASDSEAKTFERNLYCAKVIEIGPQLLQFIFIGDGFLKQMIRNIVGTAVDVGRGQSKTSIFRDILQSGDRTMAGMTAPAQGLILEKGFLSIEEAKLEWEQEGRGSKENMFNFWLSGLQARND